MKISFATLGCPSWTLEQIAENAAKLDYDGVDLRGIAGEHIGPDEPRKERARIRALFEDAGVEIACIMGYSRFTMEETDKRNADIDVARKLLVLAKDIGCPILRVFGGLWNGIERSTAIERVTEGVSEVAKTAEDVGVKVAIETHDDWCPGENIRAILAGVDSPAVGVCWDIANSSFVEPMEKTYSAIADKIFHVHFKDAAREGDAVKSKLLGKGQVDLRKAMRLLKLGGYKGYLSFEWEKKWQPDIEEPEVAFPHYIGAVTKMMAEEGIVRIFRATT